MMESCRFCGEPFRHSFADLGMSPLSNAFLNHETLNQMEPFYPLRAFVCNQCLLVQLPTWQSAEAIFTDYAYFSSFSDSWLDHSRRYADAMVTRLNLDSESLVVEVASNDGYLLKFFKNHGVPVLGVEPARNVAQVAEAAGIPCCVDFFGTHTAQKIVSEGKKADLLIGNNVLAHVPNLNDFVEGLSIVLKAEGVITVEFPHIMELIHQRQFDTIYHEHFCYFSFYTLEQVFTRHGFHIFDVEQIPTHGGSLRVFAQHRNASYLRPETLAVGYLRDLEAQAGLDQIETYLGFQEEINRVKRELLSFLIDVKSQGKKVVGYGAPAKGNTLLNFCGIRTDLLDYTVDRSPYKQGLYLPGTHIPIYAPEKIQETEPDYVLILPWNLKEEVILQMGYIQKWGGRFVVPIPRMEVLTL